MLSAEMCSQNDGQCSSPVSAVSMDSPVVSQHLPSATIDAVNTELTMPPDQQQCSAELVPGGPTVGGDPGHVVMLHILDGESIQFQHGDSFQLITGPATVPMVSSGMVPPVPYPVQVPPGHVMQQVVDGTGTLRHVILAPEPGTHGPMGQSPHPSATHPQALHPMAMPVVHPCDSAHVPADYIGHPCESVPTVAPDFVEPCVDPSYMSPPGGGHPPSAGRYGNDERCRRQADRLRRKLVERRRNKSEHRQEYARNEPVYMSAPPEHRLLASATAPCDPSLSDSDSPTTVPQSDAPAVLPPPRIDEVSSRHAVISLLLPEDQLVQLLTLETSSRHQSQLPSAINIIDNSCTRQLDLHVSGGCVLLHELDHLKPATTYCCLFRVQDGDHVWLSDVTKFCTLEDVPDQPLAPVVHHRTKSSLHLRWSLPADNGSRITHCILESDNGSDGGFTEVYRGRTRQYVLSHLTPGSSLLCRLTAVNAVGASLPSVPAMFSTSQPAPPAPVAPAVQSVTAHALSVGWLAVCADRALTYTLQMERRGGEHGFRVVYSGADTSCTLHSLQPSTEYLFRVRANDENTASAWSATSCFRTASVPPVAPTRLHQRGRAHAHQVRVQWMAEDDVCDLVGFVVQSRVGEGAWQDQHCPASERECLLSHLPAGTGLQVRVLSVGEAGPGAPCAPLTVYTEPVKPGPCESPRLASRPRSASCHVTWSPPENRGGSESVVPACEYRLSVSTGDKLCREITIAKSEPLETTITSLAPGQQYQVCVCAVNTVGAGPWSSPLQFTTAPCPPDAPPAATLTTPPSAHVLSLQWPPSLADNGAPITEYRVEVAKGVGAPFVQLYSGSACHCELHDLEAATGYILRVRAVNMAGSGSASEPLLVATTSTVPSMVVGALLQNVQQDSARVEWQIPASDGGADVMGYQVQLSRYGRRRKRWHQLQLIDTADTQLQLTGLRPATVYSVRVRACNMMGAGAYSHPLRVLTSSHVPPAPILQLVQSGASFVRVEWSMMAENESESGSEPETCETDEELAVDCEHVEPLTFTLECQSGGAGPYYSVYEGTESEFRCGRLLASTTYRFRVYATNRAGDSPYSLPVSCTTAHQPAPPVKGLSVVQRRASHVDVEWQPVRLSPTAKHQLINHSSSQQQQPRYQLQLAAANSSLYSQVYDDVAARYRISSLCPSTDYQIRVRCILPEPCTSDTEGPGDGHLCGPYSAPVRFSTLAAPATQSVADKKGDTAAVSRRNRHTGSMASNSLRASVMRRFGESVERLWAMLLLFGFGVAAFVIAALVHYMGLVPSPGQQ